MGFNSGFKGLKWNIPLPIKLLRTHLNGTLRTIICEAAICVLACGFFFMCQLCDRDKIYWGHQLTLLWGSWPFKSNDFQWMNRYQFRKHKSQTEGSCKLCSLRKQFRGRIIYDTAGNFFNSDQDWGLVIFIYYVCKYHTFNMSDYKQLIIYNCKIFMRLPSSRFVS